MRRRGFTLVEIVVVLTIIVVVAAISYPVFSRAKLAALETKSVENMRQLQLAINIYRQDWSTRESGAMFEMGMPLSIYRSLTGTRALRPPTNPKTGYMYFPTRDPIDHRVPTWTEHTLKFGEQTIVLADMWFNPHFSSEAYDAFWMNPDFEKYGVGIMLAGNLVRKRGYGPIELDWWD